jgi:hypothetical protein
MRNGYVKEKQNYKNAAYILTFMLTIYEQRAISGGVWVVLYHIDFY